MRLRDYLLAPFVMAYLIARGVWADLRGKHYDPPDFG